MCCFNWFEKLPIQFLLDYEYLILHDHHYKVLASAITFNCWTYALFCAHRIVTLHQLYKLNGITSIACIPGFFKLLFSSCISHHQALQPLGSYVEHMHCSFVLHAGYGYGCSFYVSSISYSLSAEGTHRIALDAFILILETNN